MSSKYIWFAGVFCKTKTYQSDGPRRENMLGYLPVETLPVHLHMGKISTFLVTFKPVNIYGHQKERIQNRKSLQTVAQRT